MIIDNIPANQSRSSSASFILALVEYEGRIMAFERQPAGADEAPWSLLSIKGEPSWALGAGMSWAKALQEINAQLNLSSGLADGWIYFVVSEASSELVQLLQQKTLGVTQWNLLCWSWLIEQSVVVQEKRDSTPFQWIPEHLLPRLSYQVQNPIQELSPTETSSSFLEEDLLARLAQEKHQLQQENIKLKKELSLLQERLNYLQGKLETHACTRMDMETLLTYLPVIYKNFWGQIRPDELALLAGNLDIPKIPSPISEPSYGILQAKKKSLKMISCEHKKQLLAICRQLPNQPNPRPEMQFFFQDEP